MAAVRPALTEYGQPVPTCIMTTHWSLLVS